ncbi:MULTISPECIES: hemagglutinin repeat-containing protein [unclassified Pseudomonas]|uniref:hemagglutinin repeat-containing protein n=1 Tax=unclassified Pseudomonas TaxID=196821 RepID=UPI0035BFF7F8
MNTNPSIRPDTLRWAVFLAILGASPPLLANAGLQPTPGPGGTPLISDSHGIPVIGIVPPNAAGLSHNQYLDYNVGQAGVVLNNSLQAGQSQLAGALAANPQFQGHAASTILNEVVSRNASRIEGPQEIFGRPADYILANPNGITLNGGSFINTTRAGFVVGTPQIQEQQLRFLDTLNADGSLTVLGNGQSNSSGALELIAPRIDSQGPLRAKDDLNITAGNNLLDATSGEVLQHLPGTPSSIDAKLFGAMHAGRIRIISTAEGAGVRVGAVELSGRDGVAITSAGDLHISGNPGKVADLHSAQGDLVLTAAEDLDVSATHGKGRKVELKAGKKLTLDAEERENIERDQEKWNKKWLFVTTETYDRQRTNTERTLESTRLQADDRLVLKSGGDMKLVASQLQAGAELSLDSAQRLDIEAGIESRRTEEQVRHRKHLWRGTRDTEHYQETAKPSELSGATVVAKAGDTLKVQGSQVTAQGDMSLTGKQLEITTTTQQQTRTSKDYSGDLVSGAFFGENKDTDLKDTSMVGSTVSAGGKLEVFAEQVAVKGSQVMAKDDAVIYSDKGALTVEADHSQSTSTERNRNSKVFGLFANEREHTADQQQVLVSDVASSGNLRLASAEELRIQGAKVEAGKQLQVQAKGDLRIDSAQVRNDSDTTTHQRGLSTSAKQTQQAQDGKPESKQYTVSVGYQVANTQEKMSETTQVASVLKGASVDLDSAAHLQVNGSHVEATAGRLDVKAPQLTLGATRDEQQTHSVSRQSGGGLALTGGIDRLGSAFEGHDRLAQVAERDSKVQGSTLTASGDLSIDTRALVTEAAKVKAGEQLVVNAETIENRAVQNIHEREQQNRDWQASLGASVEYRDLTRPIERLVLGEEAARFQQASPEDAMAPPSIGAEMTVDHLKRLENQRRGFAQVSELSGGSVLVKANRIQDEGTAWRAGTGTVRIAADQHHMNAARNQQHEQVQRLAFGGDARVDTSTGSDVNARLSGKGGSLDRQVTSDTARVGSLYGQQGIQVQLGSDGVYEGTRIDSGVGDVSIHSAGKLTLAQASEHTTRQSRQLDGNAWAKGGNRPTGTGLDTRGYLDHEQQQASSSTAQVAQVDAKGSVTLGAAHDLLLEGTRIGSRDAPVAGVQLDSGGLLQVKAARDTSEASGGKLGGGLELGVQQGTSQGGALGGHFTHGKQQERDSKASDANIATRGTLRMNSTGRQDVALHLEGVQASAQRIELNASHGGMRIEAADDLAYRDNLDITAGAGFNLKVGETPEAGTRGLHGRLQVGLDKRNDQTWNASTLRADHIDLQSRGDTRIEGAGLEAGHITGTVGGDLLLASRKDRVDHLSVNADGRLSQEKNPQGYANAVDALAGPAKGELSDKVSAVASKAEPGLSPTFKLELSHEQRDTVAHQATLKGSDGVELNVAGEARLVGARVQSVNGEVDLRAASVTRSGLSGSDYRRDVSVDASNSPVDLGTAIADIAKGKGSAGGENALDLGLLRTSGHNRTEQWTSSVQGKQPH